MPGLNLQEIPLKNISHSCFEVVHDEYCRQKHHKTQQVIVALALGKFPLPTHGGVFEMMQAIANDPVPTLPRQSFTPELCEFVDFMLQREPADRPTACALLQHPFLTKHYRCRKVAELVTIPPATHSQVKAMQRITFWRVQDRSVSYRVIIFLGLTSRYL